ncbi:MAG: hypothetical protein M3Q27_07885 [Actinomycetota bacterium]|nr:hypothetical protein [Actinomycetota bacterium]
MSTGDAAPGPLPSGGTPPRLRPADAEPDPLHPLLDGLVDDAAIFPPGNAAMVDAVTGYLRHRTYAYGALVGRFLCSASRLGELRQVLDTRPAPEVAIPLGLVVDTGADGIEAAVARAGADPRLTLAAVEVAATAGSGDLVSAVRHAVDHLPEVEAYVELPREEGWLAGLAVLADTPYGAKLRTGGTSAGAFPTEDEVAAFIVACVAAETPFKLTAGLHHAVRQRDTATGFEHHGFVNVLVATHAATQGARVDEVAGMLAEQDTSAVAARFEALDPTTAVAARSFFTAFGSCSVDEPVADLVTLGILGED